VGGPFGVFAKRGLYPLTQLYTKEEHHHWWPIPENDKQFQTNFCKCILLPLSLYKLKIYFT